MGARCGDASFELLFGLNPYEKKHQPTQLRRAEAYISQRVDGTTPGYVVF
jgi:hypothetical protein